LSVVGHPDEEDHERPLQRRPAADDDEVVTRTGMNRHHPFRRRPKPAAGPVAADGKSDPKPGPRCTSLIAVLTAPGLDDQPGGGLHGVPKNRAISSPSGLFASWGSSQVHSRAAGFADTLISVHVRFTP
jgi:hypothetical protein